MNPPKEVQALKLEIAKAYEKYRILSHPMVVEISQKLDRVLNRYRKSGSDERRGGVRK